MLQFQASVKRPAPEPANPPAVRSGGPAAYRAEIRSDLVLRHVRQSRNVVTVARRMGVRANDVFLVVLNRMELLERRAA